MKADRDIRWAILALIVAILLGVLLISAFAHRYAERISAAPGHVSIPPTTLIHSAPSGIVYPPICCSPSTDAQLCHPIDCEEISETADGYRWRNLKFDKTRVFASFDDQCHACNSTDSGKPTYGYCLMIRQSAWQDNLRRWARMYERHP